MRDEAGQPFKQVHDQSKKAANSGDYSQV